MAFDHGAWRKAQMQAQDAKLQTSTHAPTQQAPGHGFVPEVSAVNAVPAAKAPKYDNHASRRRNRHRLAQAMAVHAASTLR